MSDTITCPRCGAAVPAEAEPGLCPRCLLVRGIEGFAPDAPAADASRAGATAFDDATPLCAFGDYELLEEIGRGGMGIVYRARQRSLNRIVALKIILAGRWASDAQVQRFRAEAEAAAALAHPNIVPIHEIGERQGQQFFSMKLVEGGSLAERCERRREKGGPRSPLAPHTSALLLLKIARAVHFAHQRGIVHRDLKPTNVLLDRDGEPHLTDFGLAKRLEHASHLTHTQTVLGTPAYMAPEQAAGRNDQVTVAVDTYSLGAILYEMLAGQPPFSGSTPLDVLQQVRERNPRPPRALNRSIPRDLETICLKCLQKEPRRRYATAAELADDLDRWLTDRPILARPVPLPERLWLWARRNPAAASAGVLLLLLAVGSTAAALRLRQESERAHKAEHEAMEKLRASYLVQARAERLSGLAGRRARSLEAIAAAARLQPSLDLRNEAIAALALLDLGPPVTWRSPDHKTTPNRLLLEPGFNSYAVFGEHNGITLHRAKNGEVLRTFDSPPSSQVTDRRMSPDGQFLAVAYRNGRILVWDLRRPGSTARTNYIITATPSHPLAFSADSRSLVVAGADRRVRFYEASTGAETYRFEIGSLPYRMELNPSAEVLAVMTGGEVQLWQVRERTRVRTLAHTVDGTLLAWHPSGRWLAVGYSNGDLRLWDAETGEARPLAGHAQYVWSLAFDPRGEFLASQSWDATPRFWDPASGQPLFWMRHAPVFDVSRHGDRIAFRDDDGGVRGWEIVRSHVFRSLSSVSIRGQHLRSLDLSHDGRWLVCTESAAWHLFDLARGCEVVSEPADRIRSALFHPSGSYFVTVNPDELLRWSLATGPAADTVRGGASEILLSAPGSGFHRGSFSHDGRWLVLTRQDGCLLLDVNAPEHTIEFSKGRQQNFIEISPDSQWVTTSAVGAGVTVWGARDGKLLRCLLPGENAQIAISPDSRALATATTRECTLWDTQSWQPLKIWPLELSGGVHVPVAFSPDGRWVAVAATRTEVQLLDTRTGSELATLTPPLSQNLDSLIFSADGRYLAGATFSRVVQLWDLPALRRELAVLKLDW